MGPSFSQLKDLDFIQHVTHGVRHSVLSTVETGTKGLGGRFAVTTKHVLMVFKGTLIL